MLCKSGNIDTTSKAHNHIKCVRFVFVCVCVFIGFQLDFCQRLLSISHPKKENEHERRRRERKKTYRQIIHQFLIADADNCRMPVTNLLPRLKHSRNDNYLAWQSVKCDNWLIFFFLSECNTQKQCTIYIHICYH